MSRTENPNKQASQATSVVFPTMILTFPHLAHIIPPLSVHLNSMSSVKYLIVDYFICLHQFVDVGSMMTIRLITNLIIGEGQFSQALRYC